MNSKDVWDSYASRPAHEPVCPPPPGVACTMSLPEEVVEAIAEHAAAIVLERLSESSPASPYLSVAEAAERIRAKPQRVHDLLSARKLKRYKDGRRTLVSREELDAYVAGGGRSRVAPALPPVSETPMNTSFER